MSSNVKRFRSFAFVQKVSALPDDWQERFASMMVESAYIVHDRDTGTDPHVHFFLYYQGKRSVSGVLADIPDSFGIPHVEVIRSKNGYLRYVLHWNPEDVAEGKHRYEWAELHILGGLKVNASDLAQVDLDSVLEVLDEYDPPSFYDFTRFCKDHRPELLRYIQAHFQLVDRLISARIA